jgi:hypothetical protein
MKPKRMPCRYAVTKSQIPLLPIFGSPLIMRFGLARLGKLGESVSTFFSQMATINN